MRAFRAGWAGLLSLCLFLSACGGGGGDDGETPVTPLPTSVSISSVTQADTDAPVQLSSDVANPTGGLTFLWNFGDGAFSTEASTSHQFTAAGEYEVKLTVRNEEGAEKSTTFKITVGHFAMVKDRVCSAGANQGWCWQRPLPSGNAIADITFVDANTGWAVGDAGQILKTIDGGSTWVPQVSHVTKRLTHVRFANSTTGWIVGTDGTILKSVDAGVTWVRQASAIDHPDQPMDPGLVVLDERRVVAMPGYYTGRATTDGGETWSSTTVAPREVTRDGTVWNHDSSQLFKATSLGADEPTISFSGSGAGLYLRHFTMGDESRGLLMAYDWTSSEQQLQRTTNAGNSWSKIEPIGLPDGVGFVDLVDGTTAWAATSDGLYRSTDLGSQWRSVTLPAGVAAFESWGTMVAKDARTFWFEHERGIYLTTNAGRSWNRLSIEQERDWPEKLSVNAGGWWLQYGDRIYRSRDNGATWVQAFGGVATEDARGLSSVWFFDAQEGLAVGEGGTLLKTTNGGRDWTAQGVNINDYYDESRLQFVSRDLGWMSGPWGVSKTTDGGASWWTPVNNGGLTRSTAVHFVDAINGWALSIDGVVFRTVDAGNSWQSQDHTFWGSSDIRFLDSRTGFVIGESGTVRRTDDGGATWTMRPTGVFERLYRIKFVDASTGWAVGDNGAVITSTDAGLTWIAVPVPSRQRLLDVAFADSLHGWIVGEEGTVLATVDGGKTWALESSGFNRTLRSAFFLDAHTGWIVGSGGAVLATATGGR